MVKQNEFLVPSKMEGVFQDVTLLTDSFCRKFLNDEYAYLCRKLTAALCRKRVSLLTHGKPLIWAAAVVSTVGWVNFLSDKSQKPHISAKELSEKFGVGMSTMAGNKRQVVDALGLIPLDPDYTLPSKLAENPLVWMVEVNGFVVDIRMAPREVQEIAYEKGLIPFIPDDEKKSDSESEGQPKILKFPIQESSKDKSRTVRQAEDQKLELFD
jgi:hypothetical protein